MLVVAGPHVVDVGLLHQLQVFQPVLAAHGTTHIGVLVVAVDTAQLHGLAVDAEYTILGADLADAHPLLALVGGGAVGLYQLCAQCVKIRSLCRPQVGIFHVQQLPHLTAVVVVAGHVDGLLGHDAAGGISQCEVQAVGLAGAEIVAGQRVLVLVGHHHLHVDVAIHARHHRQAVYAAVAGHPLQLHVAVDAAQRPVVVGVGLVAGIHLAHAHRQHVILAGLQGRRGIHSKRCVAAVVATEAVAVEPHLGRVPHPTEVEQHPLPFQRGRHLEMLQI